MKGERIMATESPERIEEDSVLETDERNRTWP